MLHHQVVMSIMSWIVMYVPFVTAGGQMSALFGFRDDTTCALDVLLKGCATDNAVGTQGNLKGVITRYL